MENSGAACPGLIEATQTVSISNVCGVNSGAACPGLIEADTAMLMDATLGSEFRGSLPRPH